MSFNSLLTESQIKTFKEIYGKEDKLKSQNCLHKSCPLCQGTGIQESREVCIHGVSCPCRDCNPYSL